MCRQDNHDHENGAYYVSSRNVAREDLARYSPTMENYFGGYQNA